MTEQTKEPGFYLAKSRKGDWYTVLLKDGEYAWTSEMYGVENCPKSIDEFVEWVKVEREE